MRRNNRGTGWRDIRFITKGAGLMSGGQHDYEREFAEYLAREKHLALMVRSRAAKYGERKIAVRHKPHDSWIEYTWGQFGEMIDACAKGLLALEVKEFEFVGIFSNNSVWWAIADYAAFTIRACSVPIYGTNSAKETEYIVDHAEIKVLFVGNQDQYDKAMTILGVSPNLQKVIVFDPQVKIEKSSDVMYLDDFLEMGRQAGQEKELANRLSRLDSEDLSTLIYTSGTTGTPKGVMLTHKNWFAMLFGAGPHDGGCPVGTAGRGHDGAHMETVRSFLHQPIQHGRIGFLQSVGRQPVTSNNHDMFNLGNSGLGVNRNRTTERVEYGCGNKGTHETLAQPFSTLKTLHNRDFTFSFEFVMRDAESAFYLHRHDETDSNLYMI